MKKLIYILLMVFSGFIGDLKALAQGIAPITLAAQAFSVSVQDGVSPFATNGQYQFFTSPLGTNFVALGQLATNLTYGTYSYSTNGSNAAVATFLDAQSGQTATLSLSYTNANAGQLTWSNAVSSSYQTAQFTVSNYTTIAPPQLFFAGLTNGSFQSYLGGQMGATCGIDVSSNLVNWVPLTSVHLSDLTVLFTDTNPATLAKQYYRARTVAMDFAPTNIGGLSLVCTVTAGTGTLATNGFFQWFASSPNNGYQMLAGTGLTNSTGTFTYSNTTINAGLITYPDSANVTNFLNLVFTNPMAGFFYQTNTSAAGSQAGTFSLSPALGFYLGYYRFTPDLGHSASASFAADGNPISLSVTDAFSNIWTLTIPGDALIDPQTITMTAVTNIDSSQAVLPASAAVVLGPDGTQFNDALTLTLTPPKPLGTNATLLGLKQDGSHIEWMATTARSNTYSTQLTHFSSVAITDPSASQLQPILNNANQLVADTKATIAGAAAYVKGKNAPPPPPYSEWTCDPGSVATAKAIGDNYYNNAFAFDLDFVEHLTYNARQLNALGYAPDVATQALAEAGGVVGDMQRQTLILLRTAGQDRHYLPAIIEIALRLIKQAQLVGVGPDPFILAELGGDLSKAGSDYIKDIKTQHRYSEVAVIPLIAKNMDLLAVSGGANLIAAVQDAMSFTLNFDIVVSEYLEDSAYGGYATWKVEAQSTIPIIYSSIGNLQGSKVCNYTSGSGEAVQDGFTAIYSLTSLPSFQENCGIMFSDCPVLGMQTATVNLSSIPFIMEKWSLSVPGVPPVPQTYEVLWSGGVYCFSDFSTEQGYSFPATMQDGNGQAIQASFAGTSIILAGATVTATLQFTLQHTPK